MLRGVADERIPFGAKVLCRGFRVRLDEPALANRTARSRPTWCGDPEHYEPGEHLFVDAVEGLGERDLHALANAPLMDANNLYLPAGKLSMAETLAREASSLESLSPTGVEEEV